MNEILELLRSWGPAAVTTASAIAINRTLKKHDDLVKQVNKHETRLAIVETRCEERGGNC